LNVENRTMSLQLDHGEFADDSFVEVPENPPRHRIPRRPRFELK
jgi:hypothetical protein